MSRKTKPEPEPERDDDDDDDDPALSEEDRLRSALMYWQTVLENAFKLGIIYVEAFMCENCKKPQFVSHRGGVETLKCENCGHNHASKSPRHPHKGEVRLDHSNVAYTTLKAMYSEKQKLLSPLSQDEISAQPEAVKHLLARMEAQAGKEMLNRWFTLMEAVASIDE